MGTDFRAEDVVLFQREGDKVESVARIVSVKGRALMCRPYPENPKAFDFCLVVGIDWIVVALRDGQKYEQKGGEPEPIEDTFVDFAKFDDESERRPRAKMFYAKGRKKIKKRKGPTR